MPPQALVVSRLTMNQQSLYQTQGCTEDIQDPLTSLLTDNNVAVFAYYDAHKNLVACDASAHLNSTCLLVPKRLDEIKDVVYDELPQRVSLEKLVGYMCLLTKRTNSKTPYLLCIINEVNSLSKIMHDLPVGVLYLDKHFDAVFANAKCADLMKTDIEHLMGRQWTTFMPDDVIKQCHLHISDKSRCRTPFKYQIKFVSPLGKKYVYQLYFIAYFDHRDNFISAAVTLNDVTFESQITSQLKYRAEHDELTELLNRKAFIEKAEALSEKSLDYALFVFIDLDKFKEINDNHGHSYGDQVLRLVANNIVENVSDADLVARLGGDEFAICMPNITSEDAVRKAAKKIVESINVVMQVNGKRLEISASIGLAWTPAIEFESGYSKSQKVHSLIAASDQGMYEVKWGYTKTDKFKIYDESLRTRRLLIKNRTDELCQALQEKRLRCYFQPIYNCSGGVASVEALARFNPPLEHFNGVDEVIGFSKELGIGETFFREALQSAVEGFGLLLKYSPDTMLNLNVDVSQLEGPAFVEKISDLCNFHKVPYKNVRIEITEHMLEQSSSMMNLHLKTLILRGFTISMDDFGIGYSSFKRLLKYDFHELKIDRYFVDNIGKDEKFEKMFKAMVAVGRSFNLEILAEGIETQQQYNRCKELGAELFQGYFLSRPLPIDDLICGLINTRKRELLSE